jgi:hypothetical protein
MDRGGFLWCKHDSIGSGKACATNEQKSGNNRQEMLFH